MARKSNRNTPVVLSGILYTNDEHTGIRVESAAWWTWVETHGCFYYQTERPFTARQETRRNGQFWYAYRRSQGKLYKVYLGVSDQLTAERLAEAAQQLAERLAPAL